jgi:hypothetical protein
VDGAVAGDVRGGSFAMHALPPETLHLPFVAGPYRMAMGLTTLPEEEWFEFDDRYVPDLLERRRLLAEHHAEVFAALPVSDAARAEALADIVANLTAHRSDWFRRDGDTLHNRLTGEASDLASQSVDPLELAGRLVQEDLCIIQLDGAAAIFTAAVLCFPSHWILAEKIGRPLPAVHEFVPFFADRLARPVDRFMHHLKPGHIAARLNWSVSNDPALHQPVWSDQADEGVTPANAGERLFLRVERQTLRRLPSTNAVLFGIRVHVYPMRRAITSAATATRLADALRAMPEAMLDYKGLLAFRDPLLGWLDARTIM